MSRTQRLKPVQELAARDEREAAAQLGERVDQVAQARRRLDDLLAWERDYAARMREGAVNLAELQSYRLFMQRLGEAIEQQRRQVVEAESAAAQARDDWQSRHARHAALSKFVERCLEDEREAAERREQRQQDEFSMARAYAKR